MADLNRDERIQFCVVKAAMDRVKITLVVLLPALWLMASGQRFLDPCANCTSASVWAHSFKGGNPCPSAETGSVDLSARRANSRISSQPPKPNFFSLERIGRSESLHDQFFAYYPSNREGLNALAIRWQFDCRAAPEPRAPSSVS